MIGDYGALIRSGMAIVPDYQQQQAQQQEFAIRKQEAATRQAMLQQKAEEARQQQERQKAYRDKLATVMANPTAQGIFQVMAEFPEASEGMNKAWSVLDESQKAGTMRDMGAVISLAAGGDRKGAADKLRQRVEADRAAGQPDEEDERLLRMLESDDPQAHKIALTLMSSQLYAVGGDKAKAFLEQVMPKPDYEQANGIVWDKNSAQVIGQLPGAGIRTVDGVGVVNVEIGGVPLLGGNGAVSLPGSVEQPAPSAQPASPESRAGGTSFNAPSWAKVTSAKRTPERNRQVGGKPNSWHLTDMARDYVPTGGQSMAQLAAELRRMNPGMEVINEGDHVHLEPPGRPSRQAEAGPAQVKSKQQYDRLPKGAQYVAPDGSMRVKG